MATDSGQQDDGSAAIVPFGSVAYCPKCGAAAHDAIRRWVWKESEESALEHLALTCSTCGYAWKEALHDAQP